MFTTAVRAFTLTLVILTHSNSFATKLTKPFLPTSAYTSQKLLGFNLKISPKLLEHKESYEKGFTELKKQLTTITKVVPKDKLELLQKTTIWCRWNFNKGAACVHWGKGWLTNNGHNPDKASSVELSNWRNFTNWSQRNQPCMVLHELAHYYHCVSFKTINKPIKKAYDNAMKNKLYEKVKHSSGKEKKAYAAKNHKEYFSELTEAYFGKNDFYPFNRKELKAHDPVGYKMIEEVWGTKNIKR